MAAETALVRVAHHYGARPEFVVLGGLVPEFLCSSSSFVHAGTTDVDVQVDLEIACGFVNCAKLERALRSAEFSPDAERVWRWIAKGPISTIVKFDLLADVDTAPSPGEIQFDGCEALGAANLRGTGFASKDISVLELRAWVVDTDLVVEVFVAGLAGFLLAKCAAAKERRLDKDWYDLAFVLLHNDAGGPEAAAQAVTGKFHDELPAIASAIDDLAANFADTSAQGPVAYARQMAKDHPEVERSQALADAVVAVQSFCDRLKAP